MSLFPELRRKRLNILIFHQYFRTPNQSGSTRMYSFINVLRERGHNVTIITGSSLRAGLDGFKFQTISRDTALYREILFDERTKIFSVRDFYDQEISFIKRIFSFLYFALTAGVIGILRGRNTDIIFASSTPLSIVVPAIFVSRLKRVPFIFEVRDLWPEAPVQLGVLKNKFLIALAELLEKTAYRNAIKIIGISNGICKKIELRSGKKAYLITHGVEDEFFREDCKATKRATKKLRVIYAGSCGFNNAIEVFIGVARRCFDDSSLHDVVDFILIGDGPALNALSRVIPRNLTLMGKLPKKEVVQHLCSGDIALFSQRKVAKGDVKKDSLPNKFFDFIGASLPMVAGVEPGGEMDFLINTYKCGFTSAPEDVETLYLGLKKIIRDDLLRRAMAENAFQLRSQFARSNEVNKFVDLVEETVMRETSSK